MSFGAIIFEYIFNNKFIGTVVIEFVGFLKTDIFENGSAGGKGDIKGIVSPDIPLFYGKVIFFKVFA